MAILYVLLELGLIRGYKMQSNHEVWVSLRFQGGNHIFNRISLVSKPSKRVYWNMSQLYKEIDKNDSVIYLISTKEGIVIGSDCIWRALTGEVLIKIVL
jgi:ribosomal protein S8